MSHRRRLLLMPAAAVAVAVALSLILAPVVAQDDPMASGEPMESMEPMGEMRPGLNVIDPWTRESMMLELAGAAYMIIHNNSDADDALVAASSPAANVVEIHQTSKDEEGMMGMAPVEEVPIPPHSDAILEPGGYHIMLIELVEPLVIDSEIEITLEFASAEPQVITVPVRETGPMGGMDMGDGDDMGDMGPGCVAPVETSHVSEIDPGCVAPDETGDMGAVGDGDEEEEG